MAFAGYDIRLVGQETKTEVWCSSDGGDAFMSFMFCSSDESSFDSRFGGKNSGLKAVSTFLVGIFVPGSSIGAINFLHGRRPSPKLQGTDVTLPLTEQL